jgi:copper(I)-binding protein
MFRRTFLALMLAAPLGLSATAQAEETGVTVTDAFARETIGLGTTGAAFMTIANTGTDADRLVAGATPAAGKVELHTHEKDGDVMRMRRVEAIAVPAGGTALLKPGGDHVMLFDLAAPLKKGETFAVTLTFETAGDITVEVPVVGIGESLGMTPDEMGHDGMDHGSMDHGAMNHDNMDHDNMDHGQ